MREEIEKYFGDDDREETVLRYEKMKRKNALAFFDVHEFEDIINFYIDSNKFDNANEVAEFATRLHPNSLEIQIKKAQLLIDDNKSIEALNILKKIEKIESSNIDLYLLQGKSYCALGDFKKSVEKFDKALQFTFEEKEEILNNIALTFENAGNYKLALRYFKMLFKQNKRNENVIFDIAFCLERLGEDNKSISLYLKYLDSNPFSENAWYNLGVLYNKIEEYDKAIDAYDFAIAIDEDYSSAFFNKANSLANKEEYDKAIDLYKEYLGFHDNSVQALYYIGECYEKMKSYDDAIEYYKKTLKENKEFSDAWFGIGIVNFYQGNYYESFFFVKKAIKLDEGNPEYWFILGKIHSKTDQVQDAVSAFKQATELDPYDEEIWITYSELFYNNDRISEAVEVLKESCNYISASADVNYRLTAYLIEMNDYELALIYLENALKLDYDKYIEFFEFCAQARDIEIVNKLITEYKTK